MPFQSTVNQFSGAGVVGELFDDGPLRAQPYQLDSSSADNNVFGRAFTIVSQGVAQAGGTGIFAGILVNPKTSASVGDSSSPLNPTLTLPNFSQAEILTMGSIWVTLPAAAAIGDQVVYDTTTGVLSTISPGNNLPVGTAFAYAVVDRFTVTAAGLAVITLTPQNIIPTAP
jgi:hypothetical protein